MVTQPLPQPSSLSLSLPSLSQYYWSDNAMVTQPLPHPGTASNTENEDKVVATDPAAGQKEESPIEGVMRATRSLLQTIRLRDFDAYK